MIQSPPMMRQRPCNLHVRASEAANHLSKDAVQSAVRYAVGMCLNESGASQHCTRSSMAIASDVAAPHFDLYTPFMKSAVGGHALQPIVSNDVLQSPWRQMLDSTKGETSPGATSVRLNVEGRSAGLPNLTSGTASERGIQLPSEVNCSLSALHHSVI